MHDAFDDIRRVWCVVGWLVSTQPPWSMATSTITLPFFIVFRSDAYKARRLGAGDQHRADRPDRPGADVANGVRIAEDGVHVGGHHVVEIAQPIEVDVHEDDIRAQPRRHFGGVACRRPRRPAPPRAPARRPARRRAECRGPSSVSPDISPLPGCSSSRRFRSSASAAAAGPARSLMVSYAMAMMPASRHASRQLAARRRNGST